jgi:hypothetical protein
MGSSAQHRMTDVDCPCCEKDRSAWCDLCLGVRKVKLAAATDWILAAGKALDSMPPSKP